MNQHIFFRSIENGPSHVQLGQKRGEGGRRTRESNLPGDEGDVLAAKTKAVGGDRLALVLAGRVGDVVEIARRVGRFVVDRRRHDVVLQRHQADD